MSDPAAMHEVFDDLRRVARGLSLVFSSYVIRIMAVVFGVILVVVFHNNHALMVSFALIAIGAFLVGMFMGIRGRSLCLAVPEGSKAKNYIWGAVTVDLIGIGLIITETILEYPQGLSALLTAVGEFLSLLFFVVFLRHTAELIRNDHLVSRAHAVILNGGFICGSSVALFIVVLLYGPVRVPNGGAALLCSGITLLGMALVVLIQYANLIRSLGRSIEEMVEAARQYIEPAEDSPRSQSDTFG